MALGCETDVGAGLAGFSRHRLAGGYCLAARWAASAGEVVRWARRRRRHRWGEEDGAVYRAGLDFGWGMGYHKNRRLYTSVREGVLL